MRKNTIIKCIVLGLSLFAIAPTIRNTQNVEAYSYTINAKTNEKEAIISDENLKTALLKILNKAEKTLYFDDFKDFKGTTLDLSSANIENVIELAQFQFPETLVAIDLSNNNINNNSLQDLETLLKANTDKPINYKEKEITVRTNFNKITKVNLNFNKIDLDQNIIGNKKIIFGIQNYTFADNELYKLDELSNSKYYIKSSDYTYLSMQREIKENPNNPYTNRGFTLDKISPLIGNTLGDFKFKISKLPNTDTSYFKTSYIKEISVFDFKIADTFKVERKHFFSPLKSDIIINGILRDYDLQVLNEPSTNKIGKQKVTYRITYNNKFKDVTLDFLVVDTVKPEIKLTPNNTNIIYWRKNKPWKDPGYVGLDSGEDITHLVQVNTEGLDVSKIGRYYIEYTLSDLAGLKADTVKRIVIIQEQVLDEITLRSANDKYVVGEEIILSVQPSEDIDITKYKDFVYYWYMDGVLFKTTSGDTTTGKSSTIITLDSTKERNITVQLKAKQKLDNSEIIVDSQTFRIKAQTLNENTALIIALVVALSIITLTVLSIYLIKHKKTKKLSNKKIIKSNKKNNSKEENKDASIQVIKNYQPGNDNNNTQKDNNENKDNK